MTFADALYETTEEVNDNEEKIFNVFISVENRVTVGLSKEAAGAAQAGYREY